MPKLYVTTIGLAVGTLVALAVGRAATPTIPVQMTVTVEARHGNEIPVLNKEDVMVFQRKERLRVTNLVPGQGKQAALELFILIDDGSGISLGSQLGDLRHFIEAQPATTSIAIGYMRNGTAEIAQAMTTDHQKAAQSLRVPIGTPGIVASPFLAVSDVIKRWQPSAARHEVLLVTSGVDPLGGLSSILTWIPLSNMHSALEL